MKYKLMIATLTLCILLQCDVVAGYESTVQEEETAHIQSIDDAYLTSHQEETAHMKNVDDAYTTENQEESEHMNNVNDAYTTEAAERAERS